MATLTCDMVNGSSHNTSHEREPTIGSSAQARSPQMHISLWYGVVAALCESLQRLLTVSSGRGCGEHLATPHATLQSVQRYQLTDCSLHAPIDPPSSIVVYVQPR